MNELDDVLAVKGFVEDYLTKFYGEEPVIVELTKAIKSLHVWDLSVRVRVGNREYGLAMYVDGLRGICVGHAITSVALVGY